MDAVSLRDPTTEILTGSPKPRSTAVLTTAVRLAPGVIPSGSAVLVNHEREMYALYLPQYRFDITEDATKVKPRSPKHAMDIEYAIMDLKAVSKAESKQLQAGCFPLASSTGPASDDIELLRCSPGWIVELGSIKP